MALGARLISKIFGRLEFFALSPEYRAILRIGAAFCGRFPSSEFSNFLLLAHFRKHTYDQIPENQRQQDLKCSLYC